DLRRGAAHSGHPVDELALSGRPRRRRIGVRAGVGLRGCGSGRRRLARGAAAASRVRALLIVLLLGPTDRRVLDAAEDRLAEEVVVRAGVLEGAPCGGRGCGAVRRGATRRGGGLAVLGVLVVHRRGRCHRRGGLLPLRGGGRGGGAGRGGAPGRGGALAVLGVLVVARRGLCDGRGGLVRLRGGRGALVLGGVGGGD